MSDEGLDWRWKVGTLAGWGEVCWQQLLGKIRRVTFFALIPNGQFGMRPALFYGFLPDKSDPQFDAEKLVIAGCDVKPEIAPDLDRVWNQSRIMLPRNGMGPRAMG